MTNQGNDPREWRVPTDRGPKEMCFEGGLSSIAFDAYVFGALHYELIVEDEYFNLIDKRARTNDEEVIARLPLPASFDEVVTWARMTGAIIGDATNE